MNKNTNTSLQQFSVPKDSVILLRYSYGGDMPANVLFQKWQEVCRAFPDNDVIAIPDEISLEGMPRETAIKMIGLLQDSIRQLEDGAL